MASSPATVCLFWMYAALDESEAELEPLETLDQVFQPEGIQGRA